MRKYNYNISERANESLNKREAVVRGQRRLIAFIILVIISLGILLVVVVIVAVVGKKRLPKMGKMKKMDDNEEK